MKKSKRVLMFSCCFACILFFFPSHLVMASNGGQVSVPGTITFESETQDKDGPNTTISKESGGSITESGKTFYSALPKTGEKKNQLFLVSGVIVLGLVLIIFRKRTVKPK